MKHIILLLFIILGISFNSNACLNLYYTTDKEGHTHVLDDLIPRFNINFNNALIERRLIQYLHDMEEEASFEKLSDYAVLLMKAGKIDLALSILQQISYHHPKAYKVAANLGTAYELKGELDSALFYIKKGMELNPNAHDGSEWVHIRVLETKKALQEDDNYLIKNSVLNLTEDALKIEATADQLLIQVQERFPFTPNHDAIMANLFYDLGRCFVETKSLRYAKRFFEISYKYYGGNEAEAKERIADVQKLKIKNENIKPENENLEGMMGRLSIRYKDLFDDNNNPPHIINWEKINTNLSDLLAMNDIIFVTLQKEKVNQEMVNNDTIVVAEESSIQTVLSKSSNNTLFFTFIVAVSLILAALFFIRRAKR